MKRLLGWLAWAAAIAVVLVVGYGLFLFDQAGQFRTVEPVDLPCRLVSGMPGAEDIVVDSRRRTALVSSTDRAALREGRRSPSSDGLFALDLTTETARRLEAGFDLAPHGISLVETGAEVDWLFAVAHGEQYGCSSAGAKEPHHATGPSVALFDWDGELRYRSMVCDELLTSPNDVAGVDANRFYATNDHGTGGARRKLVDDLLRRKRANVVYWDGRKMRVVAEGLAYANGVVMSADQTEVFVAATSEGRIHHYQRDVTTGDLSELDSLELGTGVDNLTLDRHGSLWVAAHPKLISFMRHAGDVEKLSPSEVIWISNTVPERKLVPVWRSLGVDAQGIRFSGASVAVPYGARLLIGSVFEPGILICQR